MYQAALRQAARRLERVRVLFPKFINHFWFLADPVVPIQTINLSHLSGRQFKIIDCGVLLDPRGVGRLRNDCDAVL